MPSITAVINAAGGSFVESETEQRLRTSFESLHLEPEILFAKDGDEIRDFARRAADGDSDIIVAGGGDGTISSVAAEAFRTGKTLGIIPLGTLNNFSKDLNIPQELEAAVAVLAAGKVREIDLGEVNGKLFLNNSSIGLYPRIVRKREKQQRLGYGKWRSALWAAMRVFTPKSFVNVGIEADGKMFVRRVPFVFVGNNRYEMDALNIGRREVLDTGKLSLYFLHRGGRLGVVVLLFRTLLGIARQWKDFEEVLTDEVTIQTRRRRIQVARDGEVSTMTTPLRYRSIKNGLKVIVPQE